jgi:hypothetical protein
VLVAEAEVMCKLQDKAETGSSSLEQAAQQAPEQA